MKWSAYKQINTIGTSVVRIRIPEYDIFAKDRSYMEVVGHSAGFGDLYLSYYAISGSGIGKSCSGLYVPLTDEHGHGVTKRIDITDIIAGIYEAIDTLSAIQNPTITLVIGIVYAGTTKEGVFQQTLYYAGGGISPLLDYVPAVTSGYASSALFLTPPERMLYTSIVHPSCPLLVADNASSIWSVNGTNVPSFFDGLHLVDMTDGENEFVLQFRVATVLRYSKTFTASLADECREWCAVSWAIPCGLMVMHTMYLSEFGNDSDGKDRMSDVFGGYRCMRELTRKGTMYIDGVSSDYDLWYYQQILASEDVRVVTQSQYIHGARMPLEDLSASYYGVRITGCNVKNIIVDGINSRTIEFEFEYSEKLR